MVLNSDYSITKLFFSKQINISADDKTIQINIPTIKDIFTDSQWSMFYHLITNIKANSQLYSVVKLDNSFDLVKLIIFELGQFSQFTTFYNVCRYGLAKLFTKFNLNSAEKSFESGDVTITREIWDYVLNLLKLSCGDTNKENNLPHFDSEEARQFYLAQQKLKEKINQIRSQGGNDNLMKVILGIAYSFPALTFDYLCNQTVAQIHWLQKYAAGAMSYEFNAKAFAAGNVKKGAKLEPFIK